MTWLRLSSVRGFLALVLVTLPASTVAADSAVVSLSLEGGPLWTNLRDYYVAFGGRGAHEDAERNIAWSPQVAGRLFLGGAVSDRVAIGVVIRVANYRWNAIGPTAIYDDEAGWSIGVGVDGFPSPGRRGAQYSTSVGLVVEDILSWGYSASLDVGYAIPFAANRIASFGGGLSFRHVFGIFEGDHGDYHVQSFAVAPAFVVRITRRCGGAACRRPASLDSRPANGTTTR